MVNMCVRNVVLTCRYVRPHRDGLVASRVPVVARRVVEDFTTAPTGKVTTADATPPVLMNTIQLAGKRGHYVEVSDVALEIAADATALQDYFAYYTFQPDGGAETEQVVVGSRSYAVTSTDCATDNFAARSKAVAHRGDLSRGATVRIYESAETGA